MKKRRVIFWIYVVIEALLAFSLVILLAYLKTPNGMLIEGFVREYLPLLIPLLMAIISLIALYITFVRPIKQGKIDMLFEKESSLK